jgi:hypothetical protein
VYVRFVSVSLKARLATPRIIWVALMVSVVLYAVLLVYVRHENPDLPKSMTPTTAAAITMVVLAEAVLSFVLPRRRLDAAIKALNIAVADEGGEVVGSFRESAPVRRVVVDPPAAVARAFAAYQQPFLLGMAICESIALFGLLYGYTGGRMAIAFAYMGGGLLLQAVRYPRLSTLVRAIERNTGASCPL